MKNPQYSILYFKENFAQHLEEIGTFLQEGKRYSGFGSQEKVEKFGPTSIIDGAGIGQEWSQLFCWLEEKIPAFNAA